MNVYFAIVSKKGKGSIKEIYPQIERKIDDLIRKTLFDYIEPTSSVQYSESGMSALFLYSLRGEKLFLEDNGYEYQRYSITNTGYPMDNYTDLLRQNGCDKNCVSKLNGVFSLCILDKKGDEIRAYNNHMRLENIYYAESDEFYFISTRALLLSVLINENEQIQLDKEALVSFLHRGYYSCAGTAFTGVTEVPIYSEIVMTPSGISISSIENLKDQYFSQSLTNQLCDEFTQELLDATKRIKNLYTAAKIGLTGGKDSRMMILAMKKIGAEFSAETGGYDDSPDVIVARRIASMLGIEHTVYNNTVSSNGIMEQDILGRTQKVLFASDCSLYGFEGCASTGLPYASDFALFNGLGGEILRGGYAKRLHLFTEKEVTGRVKRLYNTMPSFFRPEVESKYEEKYLECFNGISTNTPESMDWIYVQEHMGKWAASTMRCWGMRRLYLTPLCDEQLIKKAMKVKTLDKVDDRLIFEIIRRLDDRFITVPLAESRWTFEKDGARPGDEEGYQLRTPVIATTKRGGFVWRRQTLTDMRETMANIIFDPRCQEIFEYLKREEVEKLFSPSNEQYLENPYSSIFAWNIYTAAVMLEGSWVTKHSGTAAGFEGNPFAKQIAKIVIPENL